MSLEDIKKLVDQAMLSQAIWAVSADLSSALVSNKMMIIFKWPDVVRSLVAMMSNEEGAEKLLIRDLHDITIYPLVAIGKGYIEFIKHHEISVPPGMNIKEMENIMTRCLDVGEDVNIEPSQVAEKASLLVSTINALSSLSDKLNEIKEFYNEDRNWRYN